MKNLKKALLLMAVACCFVTTSGCVDVEDTDCPAGYSYNYETKLCEMDILPGVE
ncbi:hypothetical protein [Neptunitalea lumnitzerae]|uniref:Lipoprotein n=1 Tax=Neptunitalea lumnitzerae TaxID=2965509 RepID=A0ABQ5MJQ1_9FLAO|nr:hypothetical protein [Neptunitalea sp. Y10]GLB49265.1 hypothetical protein Y10_16330 [Neptunitalea sp. Y10]